MGDAKLIQHDIIQRNLVRRLRHSARNGLCKRMFRIALIRKTYLHLSPRQLFSLSNPYNHTVACLGYVGMSRDLRCLLLGNALKRSLPIISRLPESHLDYIPAHALAQHKERGKHQRRQNDGQHRHQIAPFVLPESSPVQNKNRSEIHLAPSFPVTIFPSSIRITLSACTAMSGLWVIITMV